MMNSSYKIICQKFKQNKPLEKYRCIIKINLNEISQTFPALILFFIFLKELSIVMISIGHSLEIIFLAELSGLAFYL